MTGQQTSVNDNANQFAQQQQTPAQQQTQQPTAIALTQQQTQQPPVPMGQAFNPSFISFNTTAPQQKTGTPPTNPSFVSFNTTAPQQQANTPPVNPYQAIIDQQQEQINALMQQNGALTGQISQMVQNGYQVNTRPQQAQQQAQQQEQPHVGQNWAYQPQSQFAPVYMPDTAPAMLNSDVSLESLAKDIGKEQSED